MAKFEDYVRGITKFGKRTAENIKTQAVRTGSKLKNNIDIGAKESDLEKQMKLLGERCYQLINSGSISTNDKEVGDYVSQIKLIKEKIAELKSLKAQCGRCNTLVAEDTKFCPKCGKEL